MSTGAALDNDTAWWPLAAFRSSRTLFRVCVLVLVVGVLIHHYVSRKESQNVWNMEKRRRIVSLRQRWNELGATTSGSPAQQRGND